MTIVDTARSLIFDEELAEPAKGFASARLEGIWWRPTGGSEIQVSLTNTTDAPLTVVVATDGERSDDSDDLTFTLAAHATHMLNTEDSGDNEKFRLKGVAGGISLRHSGAPGALIAHGFIQETNKGFSNVIEFSDPQKAKSARLDGAGLRIEPVNGQELSQVVVLRNVGAKAIVVKGRLPYALTNGIQEVVELPAQRLAPGEVKTLELTQEIARFSRGVVVATAGLEFTYTSEPGSLIAAALSMSDDRNQVFRVLMRDAQVQASSTGTYPWSIDGPASTVVYLKNATDSPKQFTMSVGFAGGSYSLDEKNIPAGQTMTFDVRSLRDQQKPDSNGKVIPLDVANGQVHWSAQGRAIKAIIGRAEQIDTEKGMSMTSACGICCQDSFVSAWMTPGTVVGFIDDTTQFSVYRENRDCYGNHYSGQLYPSNWSCDNTSVATVTYTGLATAVGVGNSLIRNPFEAFIYTDEGSYCSETPVTAEPNASCTVFAPTLTGPMTITRGQSATFTVNNASAAQVSNWRFSDGTNTVNGPNGVKTWAGIMVTSGTITVTVTQRGNPTNLSKSITVNNRTNFAFSAVTATEVNNGSSCGSVPSPPVPNGLLGQYCLNQQFNFNFNTVANGPNQGFWYITSISNSNNNTPTTYQFVVSPDLKNTGSSFYQAQCGNYNAQTNPNGYISGSVLLSNTIHHESGMATSHYSNYVAAQNNQSNNLGITAESQTAPPSTNQTTFTNDVTTLLNNKRSAIGTAAQAEPCGTEDVRYDASCTFRGKINFSPYQTCP